MHTISKTAARTLGQLVERARATGQNHVKIDANGPDSGIMAVTVEQVNTLNGLELWSIAHYYTQNGDAMRDPEIVYAVPNWEGRLRFDFAYPVERTQDGLDPRYGGGYLEMVVFDSEGKPQGWRPNQQRDVARFTTLWMRNIRAQQSL